jgi:prepilin-type N-terminal cleavage/methylation domain-containing protein
MAKLCKNGGFSLTEVLLAVGILSVGMIFIAGVFPAGIYLTTVATERTIAAVTADEAFAKVRLYATGDMDDSGDDIDLSKLKPDKLTDFNDTDAFPATDKIDPNEFTYPSAGTDLTQKRYFWSALCRLAEDDPNNRLVQVTVFVSRKVSPNLKYREPNGGKNGVRPMPVKVGVSGTAGDNELTITGDKTFINDGYTIVDDETGRIYRVLERYRDDLDTILLDRDLDSPAPSKVWVVPPPANGGRYPCIAVYQKIIIF